MAHKRKELIERIVRTNMQSLAAVRDKESRMRSAKHRIADAITKFTGSMTFVWIHAGWFAGWIAVNTGALPLAAFDPFPFGLLTMIVSLEAIFLSTFVLVSQNRDARQSEERADLDLQINLLAERELTKILVIVDLIAEKLGVDNPDDGEAKLMEEQISINELLEELHRSQKSRKAKA